MNSHLSTIILKVFAVFGFLKKFTHKFSGKIIGLLVSKAGFKASLIKSHHGIGHNAHAVEKVVKIASQYQHPLPRAGSGVDL